VAFAFATAALIGGHLDAAWARWSRPWTTVAWVFLTIGIALGSWWAYYELGWGGWWFWDPVENASFMPWLVGTALMHSLAVTEKRGVFKSWTVLLALIAFSLSLLGTFLVRSGVLTSVHAFATDPTRGVFILAFLAVVIGGSLTLYAWRGPSIRAGGGFDLVSRESMLLVNNVLLVVAAATILLGTLYPLALDAFNLGKISVGPPYFDAVFVPLMLPLLFLLGVGPVARWKQADPIELVRRLRWHFVISVVLGAVALLATVGMAAIMTFVSIVLALWITLTTLDNLRVRVMARNNLWTGLTTAPRAFYGMTLAHLGVAVFAVGVTLTSAYSVEQDVKLAPGESHELGGHRFRFDGVRPVTGPNYRADEGRITVYKGEREVAQLSAQKRIYLVQRSPMTEAAIDPGLTRDLYVALGDPLGGGAWSVRLYYKPFVRWIWLGALIMAFGGILAAADPRYRLVARRRAAQATEAAPATSRA
jgi:cytochrome c-type biogenesis protein CcmF